ncbi:MAG: tetratricopeptide repeat protein [Bdellovibrionales bacterium]|nr:tetratricopeptide repeat protein [Bdellovibrionales bacterium]
MKQASWSALWFIPLFIWSNLTVAQQSAPSAPPKEEAPKAAEEPKPKKTARPSVARNQGLKIVYASSPWNLKSTEADSAFLFFRDKNTGKVAKILLEETEPDSSTFQGSFSIGWADIDKIEPEIYIPPQEMRSDRADALAKFYQMLKDNKVTRKPVVFRKTPEGQQIVDVYDTSEQALRAHEAFKKELELARQAEEAKKALANKKVADEAAVAAAQLAERKAMMDALAQEAAKREADRVRLEQIEKQRAEERRRQQEELSAKEQQKRKDEAKAFAEAGLDFYRMGKFPEAEEKFRKAMELDPANTSYYYKYGITLYRNDKFNEALVTLKISETAEDVRLEKEYYMGLIHFRLKELEPALEKFTLVQNAKVPVLSPSAAFYRGVILYNSEKFEEAKQPFEWVLDNSNDPKLDQRAEEYIEKIMRMMAFQANKAKKFLLTVTTGAMYDSNVLLAPDNVTSQGSATDEGDVRGLVSGTAEYRFKYEQNHEFSGKIDSMYLHSANSDLSSADPFLTTLTLPYIYKGTLGAKGFRLAVEPGYELLLMEADTAGKKENILNSIILNLDNTIIMHERWYASYIFNVRQDDSLLADSIGDADADALKYSLSTKQTFFRDKSMRRAVIANFGLVLNAANGDDKKYQRLEGGVTYMTPARKDDNWSLGLSYYTLNYPDSSDSRKDTNVALNVGYTHPFADWILGGLTANYTNNQSNVSTSQYSKYSLLATATFNWGW